MLKGHLPRVKYIYLVIHDSGSVSQKMLKGHLPRVTHLPRVISYDSTRRLTWQRGGSASSSGSSKRNVVQPRPPEISPLLLLPRAACEGGRSHTKSLITHKLDFNKNSYTCTPILQKKSLCVEPIRRQGTTGCNATCYYGL